MIRRDIAGRRFNRLTALYPTEGRDSNGNVIWHCRCDCGKEVDLSYNKLMYSTVISCGCQLKMRQSEVNGRLTHLAGTCVENVRKREKRRDNSTGYTGVYAVPNGYMVALTFQGKTYYLGRYARIEEAVDVRKAAEVAVYDCFLEYYERWKVIADGDTAWGEAHPIEAEVVKSGNALSLRLWPALP